MPKQLHSSALLINGKWQRIGYVVRDVLDDVHLTMGDGDIVKIEFAWIKYLLRGWWNFN